MRSGFYTFIVITFLALISWLSFFSLQPFNISNLNEKPSNFSTLRAYEHVKNISKNPHYIGSQYHSVVRNYLIDQLEKLGLSVQTQKGFSVSGSSIVTIPENIVARIEGTSESDNALLLLSHYDSAVHSSYGASDAGSGVATILESLRAFKAKGIKPKNDIIILFSDGEEVGLQGARLFAKEHPWSKDVKLVLNFESRGSGGPSNMIVETNHGNKSLINSFSKANTEYPVASSLMYNIYKLLPNDTDSTVFREELDVPSFFFAFIDDHYDYHTAYDIPQRLDKKSLAHQGSYLEKTLDYFASTKLDELQSEKDSVYFNFPFLGIVTYPYSASPYLVGLSILLLVSGLLYGLKNKRLSTKEITQGLLAFTVMLILSFAIGYLGWNIIETAYPQYQAYLQGFTPNGHYYIIAFVLLVVSLFFFIYHKFLRYILTRNALVAPLIFWLIINFLLLIYLPGGTFFVLTSLLSTIAWFIHLRFRRFSLFLMLLLVTPVLVVSVPYIKSFPVGLGLNSIYVSCLFTTLILGLIMPVIIPLRHKIGISYIMFTSSILLLMVAHFNSNFNLERPKPNSLVYYADLDNEKAYWKSYDNMLDDWTKPYFTDVEETIDGNKKKESFESKYGNKFTHSSSANFHNIPLVELSKSHDARTYNLNIKPLEKANRITLFLENDKLRCDSIKINDIDYTNDIKNDFTTGKNRLLTYYIVDQEPINISITSDSIPKFRVVASSHTLMSNELLGVKLREDNYMPKPFILNDVISNQRRIFFKN